MSRLLFPVMLPANVSVARAHALGREITARLRGLVEVLVLEGVAEPDVVFVADTFSISLGRPDRAEKNPSTIGVRQRRRRP